MSFSNYKSNLPMGTFITIPRSLFDDDAFPPEPYSRREAYIDLIQKACYEPKKLPYKGCVIELQRGQLAISVRTLAARWGWSKSKVETVLNEFAREERIGRKSDGVMSIISILNYDAFQKPMDTNQDTNQDTNRDKNNNIITQQSNKNKKKSSKEENDAPLVFPFTSERFMRGWNMLCQQPKWKGKTKHALQLNLKDLGKYEEEFAYILMAEAIKNNWQGLVYDNTPARYEKWKQDRQQALAPQNQEYHPPKTASISQFRKWYPREDWETEEEYQKRFKMIIDAQIRDGKTIVD